MNDFGLSEALMKWLYDPWVGKMVATIIAILVVVAAFAFLKRKFISQITDNSRRYRARKLINFITYLLCAIIAFSVFSDRLGGLTVVFGVAGAGIAFALQEVISSVAGWFAITFGGFFRSSDRVQLGGIKGDVIDIGVLRTTIMECGAWVNGDLYNGRIVKVANSFVFKEPVYNYSADFEFLWDEMVIPIRPETDVSVVTRILSEIAEEVVGEYSRRATESWKSVVRKYNIEDAQVTPMITVSLLMDRINFTLRYVVEYKRRRMTQHELTTRIIEQFAKNEPQITMAATAIEIDKIAEFGVKVGNLSRERAQ